MGSCSRRTTMQKIIFYWWWSDLPVSWIALRFLDTQARFSDSGSSGVDKSYWTAR